MKTYTIDGSTVTEGIRVSLTDPYPRLILGEGGHKRATWIPLGRRDVETIVQKTQLPCRERGSAIHRTRLSDSECPKKCPSCGISLKQSESPSTAALYFHPASDGFISGPGIITDAGIIALKDKDGVPNGRHLIVEALRPDDRILVLWRVSSGYRGSASIQLGDNAIIIASDSSWHSGRGSLGETAETFAILSPGGCLKASISGRRVQSHRAILFYDGHKIKATFGGDEIDDALSDEHKGDYI